MKELIVNVLALVPEPHVQLVARGLKLLLAARAATKEVIDIDATMEEAVAEALEPWRRIKAKADAETGGL